MEFDRKELTKALDALAKIVPRRAAKPTLACVQLTPQSVSGTDFDTFATLNLGGSATEPNEAPILLNLDGFKKAVKGSKAERVAVRVPAGSSSATVEMGAARIAVPTEPLDDFPEVPAIPPEPDGGAWASERFGEGVAKTLFAAHFEKTRYRMNAVLVEAEGGGRLVATDGKRMAIYEPLPGGAPEDGRAPKSASFMLPVSAAKFLEGRVGRIAMWRAAPNSDIALLRGPGFALKVRLVDGAFPPWEAVVPKHARSTVRFNRKEFIAALKLFAPDIGIVFRLNGSGKLTQRIPLEGGERSTEIALAHSGDEVEAAFNGEYFREAAEVLKDDEDVVIDFNGQCGAAVVRRPGFRYVVMPVNMP